VDDREWLELLLECSRAALEHVQDPKVGANPQLAADLKHFRAQLEERLGEARKRSKRQE
jgi:hypothetical protein